MFNIVISDTIYNRIIASNEGSPLHRLLKQQPSRLLSSADTDYLKQHPEDVQKSPSSLYILDVQPAEALSIRRSFGVMCLSGDNPDITPLIDVNDIHISN